MRARELVLRPREAVLLGFAAALARAGFAVPVEALFAVERLAVERFAAVRFAGDFLALDERVAPALADLALVERAGLAFFAAGLRLDVERFAADLRAAGFFDAVLLDDVEAEPSTLHFPDMTRCAASATASAMIEPSLVALLTTLLAARSAVSAASSPASRIFLRAAGLALIAAAAAARPAASISLLIAAFASLSTVVSLERDEAELERDPDELEREELLRADFAIFNLPPSGKRHFNAVPVP